jgi:hypothetical protein
MPPCEKARSLETDEVMMDKSTEIDNSLRLRRKGGLL